MTGMPERRSLWPSLAIGAHLGVVLVVGFVLVSTHAKLVWVVGAIASGSSLFVLTGLIHEASHLPAERGRRWPSNEGAPATSRGGRC